MLKILVNTLTTLTLSMVSHFGGFFVSKNLNAFFLVLGRQYPVDIHSCPIYANLPSEMETKIFEPTPEGCACDQYCRNVYHDRWRGFCHGSWVFQPNSYNPRIGMSSMSSLTVVPVGVFCLSSASVPSFPSRFNSFPSVPVLLPIRGLLGWHRKNLQVIYKVGNRE